MRCPRCSADTAVLETRPAADDAADVARRRRCNARDCRYTFMTRESEDSSVVAARRADTYVMPNTPAPISGEAALMPPWADGASNGDSLPPSPPPLDPFVLRPDKMGQFYDERREAVAAWTQAITADTMPATPSGEAE